VNDGELLLSFEPESVDFIVANHFLEHCEDPIGTIENHLSKLRPGGVLFYAIPDKRYTFDFRRPRTSLSHLIVDHEDAGQASRSDHYLEWVRLVYPEDEGPPDEEVAHAQAAGIEATRYSIHFHV
jgi:SAM-dependent methyltransferase